MKAVALGEVVAIVMGQAPPSKACNFDGVGTPFVKVGEFGSVRPVIREWTTQPLKIAKKSDVLLCVVGATCGKINLGEDCAIGRSVAAIRPKPEILGQQFLYYFLSTLVQKLRSGSQGAAQTVISKEMIQDVKIPLPPLPEQQRIVAILDEAFTGLATATANAEKNLKNARELFHSVSNITLESNWPSATLESLLIEGRKISYGVLKPGKHDPAGIRLIKSQQVRDGSMDLTENFRITKELDKEYLRTRLQGGEILLNLVGASIGRSAIAPNEIKGANVSRAIAVIPVRSDLASWVQYNLSGLVGQKLILGRTGGAAQPVLNLGEVKLLPIPLPPQDVRKEALSKLELVSTDVGRAEETYQKRIRTLGELKQAMLQKAFSGELTLPPSQAIKEAAE